MKQFSIDYNGETKRVQKHWQFSVGSGHAALAHRADYLEQLRLAHDELGFELVRFHGIFNDDMHVCERPGDFLPESGQVDAKLYSFYQIGKIYDSLLAIGVKPFVELGFMPTALASGSQTIFYYKGNVTQPKNIREWQEFIAAFIRFLLNRYGKQEVRSWYFEVWNEPDLASFFKGDMQDYFRLYAATVQAIKEVDPDLIVGGPATTCSRHLDEFLAFCKKENVPVDFVSTHQYPTDALGHALNEERLQQLRELRTPSPDTSMRALLQPIFDNVNDFTPDLKGYMRREAQRARGEVGNLPLFYTEWSISSNCVAAIHDTTRASSFLVKTVLDNQGITDGSSYWTFSDIFEELFFFPDPFHGGFGLLTVDGIRKPAFCAFKLLAELPDCRYCLPITDDDVEIAAFHRENGNIVLMLYAQNFDETDKTYPVTIKLQNAPEFSAVTAKRVNSVSGNPVKLWNEMCKPAVLTRDDLSRLHDASQIITENLPLLPDGTLSMTIEENEVVLLELHRADGEK